MVIFDELFLPYEISLLCVYIWIDNKELKTSGIIVVVVVFFSSVRILGEYLTIQPALFFFFKVEIILCTLIPLLRPGTVHSGSGSCDNYGLVCPDELRMSSFLDRFPHYAWTVA